MAPSGVAYRLPLTLLHIYNVHDKPVQTKVLYNVLFGLKVSEQNLES